LFANVPTATGFAINLQPHPEFPKSVKPAAAQSAVACGDEGCLIGDSAGRMQTKGDFHELGYR